MVAGVDGAFLLIGPTGSLGFTALRGWRIVHPPRDATPE